MLKPWISEASSSTYKYSVKTGGLAKTGALLLIEKSAAFIENKIGDFTSEKLYFSSSDKA
jgi:hypothetical protein